MASKHKINQAANTLHFIEPEEGQQLLENLLAMVLNKHQMQFPQTSQLMVIKSHTTPKPQQTLSAFAQVLWAQPSTTTGSTISGASATDFTLCGQPAHSNRLQEKCAETAVNHNPEQQALRSRLLGLSRSKAKQVIVQATLTAIEQVVGTVTQNADQMSFQSLGIDSLMQLQLRNFLVKTLDMKINATVFYQCTTPASLAEFLESEIHSLSAIKDPESASAVT
ncbi:MAG: acyl carrier protein [Limnobacter sp.]|nr:acyl carrier protein [Limnobacter sp.]